MRKVRFLAAKSAALAISMALTTPMPAQAGIPVVDGTNLTYRAVMQMIFGESESLILLSLA